ncbi:MAG: GspE/PulE family protein, partial [Chthoniobacterales bacterium]
MILGAEDISSEALSFIPEPISRAHNIVAYRMGEGGIEVALLDMNDLSAIDFLRPAQKIRARLTTSDSLKQALLLYQKHLKEKFAGMVRAGAEAADSLLRHALQSNATHIHLEPVAAMTLVRYRIGGALHEAMRLPARVGEAIVERLKVLAKVFPVNTAAQEGRFKIEHGGETVGVRLSTLPLVNGEKILLRFARERNGQRGFTLESLGFHGGALEAVHKLLNTRAGLVVVAGPHRSGKTTTLYTFLDQLDAAALSVATIEKKVEYHLPHVAHTQVREEFGLDIAGGLRALLKHDPDVVMVSDAELGDTLALAAGAARRDVLVLCGADASAGDIADMFERYSPLAVLSVRLAKKLCPHCKTVSNASREALDALAGGANFGRVLSALKEEGMVGGDKAWKEIEFY